MAEQVLKLFKSDLQKELFPQNAFYTNAVQDSSEAIKSNGTVATVEIPQEGSLPSIVENPTNYPLEISRRDDDVLSYNIDYYATLPKLVTIQEEMLVNYQKRASILQNHIKTLNNRFAENALYAWAQTLGAYQVRTTDTATRVGGAPGATGNRKRVKLDDLVNVKEVFDMMNIEGEYGDNNFVIMPSSMMNDIRLNSAFSKYIETGVITPYFSGQPVTRLFGFNVIERSKGLVYDNTGTPVPKKVTTATATTDNEAALFFNAGCVRIAKGEFMPNVEEAKVSYGGNLLNVTGFFGGSLGRKDKKGVVALIQAA